MPGSLSDWLGSFRPSGEGWAQGQELGGTTFRLDIQGLRAIAILAVIAYHASPDIVTGGFVGVDIFFVISGYLITGIVIREIDAGNFCLSRFYRRRALRLLPALFIMLLAVALAGLAILPPRHLETLGQGIAASAAYVSNLYFAASIDYFASATIWRPLLHTWTLAVEEQFYLAYPLLLIWISSRAHAHRSTILGALWLLSLVAAGAFVALQSDLGFYLPITRAYELLTGALLALRKGTAAGQPPLRAEFLGWSGVVALGASLFVLNATWVMPGLAALLPCLGCAALIEAGRNANPSVTRMLSVRPLVFVGSISYALYLWHLPVLLFGSYVVLDRLRQADLAICVAITFLLAWLSTRLVEMPLRKLTWSDRKVLVAAGCMSAFFVALGIALTLGRGLPDRFEQKSLASFAAANDFQPSRERCHGIMDDLDYGRHCRLGDKSAVPDIAVWADSFGAELAFAMGEQLATQNRSVLQITASSCPPVPGYRVHKAGACNAHNANTLLNLSRDTRIRTVIMNAYYSGYPDQTAFRRAFGDAAHRIHDAGKDIILIYPLPQAHFPVPEAIGLSQERGLPLDGLAIRNDIGAGAKNGSTSWLDALATELGAQTVRPERIFCEADFCRPFDENGNPYYFDLLHLSVEGARAVVRSEEGAPLLRSPSFYPAG